MSDAPEASVPAPLPPLTMDDLQIVEPKLGGTKIIVKVRLPLKGPNQAKQALTLLNSIDLKNHIYANRGKLGLSEYGIEKLNSPRPYTVSATGAQYEHGDVVAGYEQEFRFTARA